MAVGYRAMSEMGQTRPPTYNVNNGGLFRSQGNNLQPSYTLPGQLPQQGGDLSAFGEMVDPRMGPLGDRPTPRTIPPYVPFGIINPADWQ